MVHGSGQSTTDVQCRVFVGLSLYSHQTVALTVVGELFLVVGVRTDDVNQIGRQQLTDLLQTRDVFFNKVSVFGEEVGTGVFRSENLVPVVQYVSRSEERRVGKECRCWWWRYREKKKGTGAT